MLHIRNPKSVALFDCSGSHSDGAHAVCLVDGEYIHCVTGFADFERANHNHYHHDNEIKTFTVTFYQPVSRDALLRWLRFIRSLRGKNLRHMKGIVTLRDAETTLVIYAVQNVLHPPVRLSVCPTEGHATRIVFITRGIPQEALSNNLEVLISEDFW